MKKPDYKFLSDIMEHVTLVAMLSCVILRLAQLPERVADAVCAQLATQADTDAPRDVGAALAAADALVEGIEEVGTELKSTSPEDQPAHQDQ